MLSRPLNLSALYGVDTNVCYLKARPLHRTSRQAAADSSCGARSLILGSPSPDGTSIAATATNGLAYGLLQHDMVEPFLLHFFAMSAHAYTRGSFTTPDVADITDRDQPAGAYHAAAVVTVPIYLKWMLCFEEPETRTLWLAKATPRDWLAYGEAAVQAANLTTRYGRVSFSLAASPNRTVYAVRASVSLPLSMATAGPEGGVRVRIRAPSQHAGRLSRVEVGGRAWTHFSAAEESVDIPRELLTADLIKNGLHNIVATFTGKRRIVK